MRKKAGANKHPFFYAVTFPFPSVTAVKGGDLPVISLSYVPPFYNEVTMDDDVIDISNIPYDEYKKHMKELQEKTVCPCANCEPTCDRASTKAICERYQEWLKTKWR